MMLASTTAPLAAVASVAGLILALLFGCFAVIFILAMFFRVVSGPGGRAALLLGAALVSLAAILLLGGPGPGGRASRASATSGQVEGVGEGGLHQTLAIRGADTARRSAQTEVIGIETEDGAAAVIALALLSGEADKHSAEKGGLHAALQSPVAPSAPVASGPTNVRSASSSESVGRKLRSTARQAARRSRDVARRVRAEARRSTRGLRSWARERSARGIGGMLLTAFALAAFLFVGYVFLDAGTRGQFTWSLRIVSLLAFVLFFASLARWSMF